MTRILRLSCSLTLTSIFILTAALIPGHAAELDKGHRILIKRGIQSLALADPASAFHTDTYREAGFTAFLWMSGNAAPSGIDPCFPWACWARNPEDMPKGMVGDTTRSLSSLVAVQLGDEMNLADLNIRRQVAQWMGDARSKYPNAILYCNNLAYQTSAEAIQAIRPDMLSFDRYPFRTNQSNWDGFRGYYGDLMIFRSLALAAGIPYGMYTQTFKADEAENKYREPSESELRLHYFSGLTFGYTWFAAFLYNQGATTLFDGSGDAGARKPNFGHVAEINRRLKRLSPAMTRLISTGVCIFSGEHIAPDTGKPVSNPLPWGVSNFAPGQYDPWLRGCGVENLGPRNGGLKGDVLIGWFRPLDESFDGPEHSGEVYIMVLNGLVTPDGSAADCRQRIRLDFAFDGKGTGITAVQQLRQDNGKLRKIKFTKCPGKDSASEKTELGIQRQLTLDIDGGTGELFKFATGAPFVGLER